MYYRLFSVFAIFFLLMGAVSAKITDDEKASIESGLQMFANDPEKLAVTISVLNDRYDLSDEPEFRQKIVSAAQNGGINIDDYPNLKEGKAPTLDDSIAGENLVAQEESVSEPVETIPEPVVEETENSSTGLIFFVVAIVVIVVIGAAIFILRRKK